MVVAFGVAVTVVAQAEFLARLLSDFSYPNPFEEVDLFFVSHVDDRRRWRYRAH